MKTKDNDRGVPEEIVNAIYDFDYGSLEALRGDTIKGCLEPLVRLYEKSRDWDEKDAIVHLLQDFTTKRVVGAMRDALESPTIETRAVAIHLVGGVSFEELLTEYAVDPMKVDQAIDDFKSRH